MNVRRSFGYLALHAALAVAAVGCAPVEPVGTLTVDRTDFQLRYPEAVALRLTWHPTAGLDTALKQVSGRPTVFVHLLSEDGAVARTFDHRLPADWVPGVTRSYAVDVAQSALAAPLAAGRYGLSIGLYDVEWGFRWPLETDGVEVSTREYRVATVEVPARDEQATGFEFTPGWLPAEERDQQVPMRRRLAAAAGIRVGGLRAPGALLFGLSVGGEAGPEPTVLVTSDCDGSRLELTGAGSQALAIEAPEAPTRASCSVAFEPRGSLVGCGERCPVYLEQAAFRPRVR